LKLKLNRDINGKRPDHPDYDSKTIFVPPVFMKSATPALR
jgi:hypothetical protein